MDAVVAILLIDRLRLRLLPLNMAGYAGLYWALGSGWQLEN